ncbi:methylthioribulose 1-phosphate dehydratase [Frankia sp. AgB32]|uniref:methylthioribulose 1-phosphate dehydratase n=1 Tax=Frankia sp. AgB32 TaxID=631119 RepID=UPI00200FA9EE|nr:methylthioribulose 1-phosphate dehydratase [Frankia sp. AgB32]MCK9895083.1 methylthioribulose 1-phosphate dehydratase [Frankia sp. AgB32]
MTTNPADRDRRDLVLTARRLYARGWMEGTAGNLSIRRGDLDAAISITASGREKGDLTPQDITEVDIETGRPASGGPRPSAETAIHLALYQAFPDCQAVAHAHPPFATTISAQAARQGLGSVDFENYEIIKAFGGSDDPQISLPVFRNHRDVSRIAADVRDYYAAGPGRSHSPNIFLISYHGATAWGSDLASARIQLESLEILCRLYLLDQLTVAVGGIEMS